MSKVYKLENWSIVFKDPYQAPECRKSYLQGNIYGREDIEDGKFVTTSSIIKTEDNLVYTKSGSLYELGEPNVEYEKLYPNAKERLFNKDI